MKKTRRNIFETNSSSSHSISFAPHKKLESNEMPIDEDGYIHVSPGEFGWEICNYRSQEDKLSYLVTMVSALNSISLFYTENIEKVVRELEQTNDFISISKAGAEHAKCKGVRIDPWAGYIDHQSIPYGCSLQEYLDQNRTNILDFVFGDVIVHTDNDNH